jgi:hypothetical protein
MKVCGDHGDIYTYVHQCQGRHGSEVNTLHLEYDSFIFQMIYLYDDEAITTQDLNKDIVALLQDLITFFQWYCV